MLEVTISSVLKRTSIQPQVNVFLSVSLTFFTWLASSGGKCDTNGDTEKLLLVVLRLEDCLEVVIATFRISGDQSRDCKGKVFSTGTCRSSEQSVNNDDKVTSGLLKEDPAWGVVIPMLRILASIRESRSSTLVSRLWIPAKVS